jgi:hypothetical protein
MRETLNTDTCETDSGHVGGGMKEGTDSTLDTMSATSRMGSALDGHAGSISVNRMWFMPTPRMTGGNENVGKARSTGGGMNMTRKHGLEGISGSRTCDAL